MIPWLHGVATIGNDSQNTLTRWTIHALPIPYLPFHTERCSWKVCTIFLWCLVIIWTIENQQSGKTRPGCGHPSIAEATYGHSVGIHLMILLEHKSVRVTRGISCHEASRYTPNNMILIYISARILIWYVSF